MAWLRFAALGGVIGPALFGSIVIVCAALRPEYGHTTQFISELGEAGARYASLMNVLGFIPSGLCLAAFGASLAILIPQTPSSRLAAVLIVVFGFGIALAGVFPCDPGCPREGISVDAKRHEVASVTAFIAGILGTALWAHCFRGLSGWRPMWRYSAFTSVAAIVLLGVLSASIESRTLTGVWQRLFLTTLFVWCALVGLRAFRLARPRGQVA